jgi:small subunit ribosomal protein S4
MPGVTGQNLLRLLESRIDNVVYRLGFATTRAQARQMVSHGFFNVNGKKVTIPSYTMKVGDIISVVDRKANSKIILSLKEKISSFTPLDWLDLNTSDLKAKVLSQPNLEEMEKLINTQLIVEHYSRI